jgi:BirA family transcriptional regulator, biotin operon repressor / biotin---[acetyl-CoA-carboxylase] ligase
VNPLAFDLLRRLADARFHSGAKLARELRVSRGTVWNAVRAIEHTGLELHKVRGRGYRLARPLSVLDAQAAAQHAGEAASRMTLEVVDRVGSTNTVLLERAATGAPSGAVLAAEWQDGGRGRRERPWHAEPFSSLTFSMLWRFEHGAAALSGLSLAAGLALARALRELGASDVALKWPNDVLWRDRKLGGILIEMRGDALGPGMVVIGIGLNMRLSASMRGRIDQPAVDLSEACGGELDRNRLLGVLLAHLVTVLDTFAAAGFAPLRQAWEAVHAHQDRAVTLAFADGRRERGIARGVAEDGALLLETAEGMRRLHSGEVSLRASGGKAAWHARAGDSESCP